MDYQTSLFVFPWLSSDPLLWTMLTLTIKISSSSLLFLLLYPGLVIFVIIFLAILGLSFTFSTNLLPIPGELHGIYWRSDTILSDVTQSSSIVANEDSGPLDSLVQPLSRNSFLRNDILSFVFQKTRRHHMSTCLWVPVQSETHRQSRQSASIVDTQSQYFSPFCPGTSENC